MRQKKPFRQETDGLGAIKKIVIIVTEQGGVRPTGMSWNNHDQQDISQFRTMLFSIAYNMLGTIADAEDMVQETYVSWLKSDKSHVENVRFYLIRTLSNKCISRLRKLKLEREAYKGTWLPEPLVSASDTENFPSANDNLSIGFMYLLEKLTPIERAVVILKEAFDFPYEEIAEMFSITNDSCRQHFSRGKKKLTLERTRFQPPGSKHEELMRKFLDACVNNNRDGLIDLLREDVVVYGDGGGKAQAVLTPLKGRDDVVRLLAKGLSKSVSIVKIELLQVNGMTGAALYLTPGLDVPDALVVIDIADDEKISDIYYIVNPSKLGHLNRRTN